jgi:hypothetical protein
MLEKKKGKYFTRSKVLYRKKKKKKKGKVAIHSCFSLALTHATTWLFNRETKTTILYYTIIYLVGIFGYLHLRLFFLILE